MKKFIFKSLIFFSPFLLVMMLMLILYIKADVHSDFGVRNGYSWTYANTQIGDLSTKKLLTSTVDYNSFIFGSSRTTGVSACYLQEKIPNSAFFHYANWNETIGGIHQRLKLIDSLGYSIDNAIIYLDTDATFLKDGNCRVGDHYLLTGETRFSTIVYRFRQFYSNLNSNKFKILFGQPVAGRVFPNWTSDPVTNDPNRLCSDSMVEAYGHVDRSEALMHKVDSMNRLGLFPDKPAGEQYAEKGISDHESNMLQSIKAILNKHGTNFYVFITPLYDERKFHPEDAHIIQSVFGDRLFDFSGKSDLTSNIYNYTNPGHFQDFISKMMLDSAIKR